VLDALLDAMLTAWLQGDHVFEIKAAQLLRLAPLYAAALHCSRWLTQAACMAH
jgi:hypothetical protein